VFVVTDAFTKGVFVVTDAFTKGLFAFLTIENIKRINLNQIFL